MTEFPQRSKRQRARVLLLAFCGLLFTVASLLGLWSLLTTAIRKVTTGHGLDMFHTASRLVEFNWISVLVVLAAVLLVAIVAVIAAVREHLQWRAFEKKYGRRGSRA